MHTQAGPHSIINQPINPDKTTAGLIKTNTVTKYTSDGVF